MSDELKRRLVGVGVLLAVFSLIAWWVGSRDEQASQIPKSDSIVRNYDVRDLDRIAAAQRAQQAVPEPAGEAQAPADDGADQAETEEPAETPAGAEQPAEAAEEETAAEKSKPVEAAAAPKTPSKPAEKTAQEPESGDDKPATDAKGQWIVQVSSVTRKDNADALATRLGKKGWNSFVEQGVVKGTTYYRVRVGPYADRDGADRAAKGLQKELGQKVAVMSR